jgi:hypothetical protein
MVSESKPLCDKPKRGSDRMFAQVGMGFDLGLAITNLVMFALYALGFILGLIAFIVTFTARTRQWPFALAIAASVANGIALIVIGFVLDFGAALLALTAFVPTTGAWLALLTRYLKCRYSDEESATQP